MDSQESVGDSDLTQEALHFMKSKLSQYVVNCLIAAGFDTLEVISLMNVSNSTSNSIHEIEEYVCSQNPEWLPTGKFSPGHCL